MSAADDEKRELVWALVIVVVGLAALLALGGCQTAAAIEQLPAGWWQGLESLVWAFVQDVWSVLDLLL